VLKKMSEPVRTSAEHAAIRKQLERILSHALFVRAFCAWRSSARWKGAPAN